MTIDQPLHAKSQSAAKDPPAGSDGVVKIVTVPASNDHSPGKAWTRAYSLSAPSLREDLARLPQVGQPVLVADNSSPQGKSTAPPAVRRGDDQHDLNRTVDPCKKTLTMHFLPGDEPKAMDRVKDFDPKLYNSIKDKVKDPRYIGQTGDITEATYNKKGVVNGCTFIQNVPYWLAADAALSYLDVNAGLAKKHKEISVDRLNGAGRTIGQERAIAWRNSGVHAKPGKSNHGFGHAIDLQNNPEGQVQPSDDPDIRNELHANGYRQGDSHGPLKNDLHHWSYAGPGHASEGH